ncbi:MAG: hypothetical protein ACYS5F_14285 [Planctomycetota bacterium]|jgi:hypothetical protein
MTVTTEHCFKLSDPLSKAATAADAYVEILNETHRGFKEQEWKEFSENGRFAEVESLSELITKPTEDLISATGGNAFWKPITDSDGTILLDVWESQRIVSTKYFDVVSLSKNIVDTGLPLLRGKVGQAVRLEGSDYTVPDAIGDWDRQLEEFLNNKPIERLNFKQFSDQVSSFVEDANFFSEDLGALSAEKEVPDSLRKLEEAVNILASQKCLTRLEFDEIYKDSLRQLGGFALKESEPSSFESFEDAVMGRTDLIDIFVAYNRAEAQKARDTQTRSLTQEQIIEEAFADNLAFSEQCMLLTFLPELLVSNSSKGLPYINPESSNYPLKAQGESFGFINKLVVDPSQKELFELKNEVVSQLVPYIRLYKVEKDEKGKDQQIEIKFDTNISNDLNTSSNTLRRQRGYGVGMNSFTFSYDGTDPFSAKKAISAKLSIFASTFDDLLRERDGFKYADLALRTGGIAGGRTLNDIEKENAEKLNFRLKAVVGWNVPRETFVGFSEEIRNAMYNSYITVYLTPTIHSFDFDETGAVNFDIEYLAYIEDAMAQRSFNIFSNVAVEQTAMEAAMNELNKMDCDMSNPEFQKLKKVNEEFVSTVNLKAYSSLVSKLAARDKIYFLNMTYDDVARILTI